MRMDTSERKRKRDKRTHLDLLHEGFHPLERLNQRALDVAGVCLGPAGTPGQDGLVYIWEKLCVYTCE